nr:MAG TPA: hypothetical protein [Inoviridae sp.]
MTSFVSSLFGLALFPFRSLSVFVVFPVCCSAVVFLFAFIFTVWLGFVPLPFAFCFCRFPCLLFCCCLPLCFYFSPM